MLEHVSKCGAKLQFDRFSSTGMLASVFFRRRINDIGEKSGKELSIETQLTSMINAPIPWNTRSWGFSHPTEINGTVLVKEVCVNVLEVG